MSVLPRIPQSTIEQIKLRADLPALLARFSVEKDTNGQYLCPFHEEKTGSLVAYPGNPNAGPQASRAPRYQCFGCGAGGDAIYLAQKLGRLSFPDAARLAAETSRIHGLEGLEEPREILSQQAEAEPPQLGDDPLAILAAAQDFFVGALGSSGAGAAEAREYLQSRGIGPDVANRYGVGFAPPSWSVLLDELVRLGASEGAIVEAGLAKLRKGGSDGSGSDRSGSRSGSRPATADHGRDARGAYDLFRGRLSFPLFATTSPSAHEGSTGREAAGFVPAGFGGRIVPGVEGPGGRGKAPRTGNDRPEAPKYINSPDSVHFSKGEVLFGLPQVQAALEQQEQVVALVEGYLDVLALAEAGVPAVAPCGTAFSAEQAARLRGAGAKRVLVLFDGDDAGQAATGPAVEKLLAAGMLPIVGVLGEVGESAVDPAEVLVQHGAEELRRRVEASPRPVVEYVLGGRDEDLGADEEGVPKGGFRPVQLGAADGDSAGVVYAKALRAAETIALSPQPLVRGLLAREAGRALGMPFDAILAQVYRVRAVAAEHGRRPG